MAGAMVSEVQGWQGMGREAGRCEAHPGVKMRLHSRHQVVQTVHETQAPSMRQKFELVYLSSAPPRHAVGPEARRLSIAALAI